ncbi:MAG: hypothetical protein ACKVOM_09085 [Ferruginibacter sp.]
MFNKIILKIILTAALTLSAAVFLYAQNNGPYFKDALKENREKFYKKIIISINKNLSLPFTAENEDQLRSAFYNIGLVKYKTTFVNNRIDSAVKTMRLRSEDYQKALINLINSDYPKKYASYVFAIFKKTTDAKLMAMAANYLLPTVTPMQVKAMQLQTNTLLTQSTDNAILYELTEQLKNYNKKIVTPSIKTFFAKNYLPGQVLVFSFQRKDRNYPGLTLVRDTAGDFVKNEDGNYFAVGQLARSLSNMPGYITNGNTPQGIFKMNGFDTSSNFFIGPTTNIQLSMPHEYHPFVVDGNLLDTTWSLQQYKDLLPNNFRNYHPIYGTFYAGKAGRTEIISHGTTIDTSFYTNQSYAPYSPSAGCLCTKEIWSNKTGYLQISDQLLLTQAIQKAGGPYGYLIVVELDDKKQAVKLKDILSLIK